MESGIEYQGSVPDQIQQFMVERRPVHIPSFLFSTLNNPHGHFSSQTKQQPESGKFQPVQQQRVQVFDAPENPYSANSLKQKVHGGQEGYTEGNISIVGEAGEKNSEANRWPREETLALLRIRAAMDADVKDSNVKGPVWETVSRKLAEHGFYRSAKKCKEKFENVNKYYKKTKEGRINRPDGKSYRFFSELEALHTGTSARNGSIDNPISGGACNGNVCNQSELAKFSSVNMIDKINPQQEKATMQSSSDTGYNNRKNLSSDGTSEEEQGEPKLDQQIVKKKRKRKQKLGFIKPFFEDIVKKVMEHQENLQKRFWEVIEKRDQDRLQREEAWKRQEMARLNREVELRVQEHALQSSREIAIIGMLQKFTAENLKLDPQTVPMLSAPNTYEEVNNSTAMGNADPHHTRWPKSEIYALIRLRSDMEQRFKESGPKVALWVEISTAMTCMGFNRSAKRCKEKWENINKYFRKTKGSSKKRPLNTKTCPYFHQLDTLYRKGILLSPAHAQSEKKLENHNSNSGALTNTQRDGHSQKISEVHLSHQDSVLLPITASNEASTPTNNSDLESFALLAHKRMKWNQNLINAMEDQGLALTSRSADDFSGSGNNSTHIKRFRMEGLVKKMTGKQQNQHHIFFNGFDRGDQEQDLTDNEGHHQHHHPQQQQNFRTNQVLKPTEEQQLSHAKVSQSTFMALVHELSASYSISTSRTQ